ncbi:MAG: glycosyltransferase [Waddliaceae bacterium]|jgi:glycosyltransferase involved in cell wall biosynthesis|nr:glycosyltransferase [Waddliaceae bacterium]MBT4445276.1 glycosyltransferase [Waddliaceae bacterium]
MKILHVNTFDIAGGAAKATHKLHKKLLNLGVYSTLLVLEKKDCDRDIIKFEARTGGLLGRILKKVRKKVINGDINKYKDRTEEIFSDDRSLVDMKGFIEDIKECDVVHLHWVARFIDYERFFKIIQKYNKPVVWRLADMNPFTGGCHYDNDCDKFTNGCGACPSLCSNDENDLSHKIWSRKNKLFKALPPEQLHIVTLSSWMSQKVKKSPFFSRFPTSHIPNGVDLNIFRPIKKSVAREGLNIPNKKKVVLLIACDLAEERKGTKYAIEALNMIQDPKEYVIITVGDFAQKLPTELQHIHFNSILDKRLLSLSYNAADLFVIPSLQDNFPNTVIESIACGTPVVGFNIGGVPDVIETGTHGYLVNKIDSKEMSDRIQEFFSDSDKRKKMSLNCIEKAKKEYDLSKQTKKYMELYANMG